MAIVKAAVRQIRRAADRAEASIKAPPLTAGQKRKLTWEYLCELYHASYDMEERMRLRTAMDKIECDHVAAMNAGCAS
ncbi:MAG: hypothetical protein R3C02_10450 [Planctomycetaceae bacterium]